ncbi:MAG: hypothetical protein WBP56_06870 [Polyangia bacterium]
MSTTKEIANLDKMKLNELQAKFAEVIGKKTRSPNKRFLLRKITEALQTAGSSTAGASAASPGTVSETAVTTDETSASPSASAVSETAVTTSETSASPSPSVVSEPAVGADTATAPGAEKLTKLTVPELQARYLEVVGRPTGSSDKPYLIWKIREAQKGRIPIGPRKSARSEDVTFKILPLRMEAAVVDKLDQAWKRHGLHSRMDLFRKSLHDYLASLGETEIAALLTDASRE